MIKVKATIQIEKEFKIEDFIIPGNTINNQYVEISWLELMELLLCAPDEFNKEKFRIVGMYLIKALSHNNELPDRYIKLEDRYAPKNK